MSSDLTWMSELILKSNFLDLTYGEVLWASRLTSLRDPSAPCCVEIEAMRRGWSVVARFRPESNPVLPGHRSDVPQGLFSRDEMSVRRGLLDKDEPILAPTREQFF